jgi:hypothetical protein
MATISTDRQKKLAKAIIENATREKPLNKKALLEKVGYSTNVAEVKASEIMSSAGVKAELEILGFTEHAAMKVVDEIMNDKNVDPSARLKATDQVFKVRGTYAPERSIVANIQINEIKREKTINIISRLAGPSEDS